MKKIPLIVLIALIFASCTSATPQSTQTATLSNTPSNIPTPTSAPTPFPTPTSTPLPPVCTPPENVVFYHLRFEYSTTSDWSRLDLSPMSSMLTYSKLSVTGVHDGETENEGSIFRINPDGTSYFLIYRDLKDLVNNPKGVMTFDFAFSTDARQQSIQFKQGKGDIGKSILRIYLMNGEKTVLLREIVQIDAEANFQFDMSALNQYATSEIQLSQQSTQRMLWAVYYPWYLGNQTGYCGWSDPMYTDRPLDHYKSNDRTAIEHQVELAQSAGIDGFLVSYGNENFIMEENLQTLVDIANDKGFYIGIYLETSNHEISLNAVQDQDTITKWLETVVNTYGQEKAFLKIDGKPVIFTDTVNGVALSDWGSLFSELASKGIHLFYLANGYDPSYLQVFDGISQYGADPNIDYSQLYPIIDKSVEQFPLLASQPADKIWAASVMPGFDNTPLVRWFGDWDYSFVDRENGAFYRRMFEAAIKSNADWIVITSWNEFQENTDIEPSEYYGDQYLKITKEYAEKWRSP